MEIPTPKKLLKFKICIYMAFLYNYVTFPIFIFYETTGITYDDPTFCCSASFAFLLPPPLEPDALLPPGGGFFFPGLLFMLPVVG